MNNNGSNDANYDPDDAENYTDVGEMVQAVTGEEPVAGEPFSLADELKDNEDEI